jgi:purine-nucleoside phosphorylase
MGRWAEAEFGRKILPPRAYLFAGVSRPEKVDAIISTFGTVLLHRQDVYERFLVSGTKGEVSIMFQLYGAPIMCDLVSVLRDGEVSEAVFLGYACGIADNLQVGDCVIPTKVQTLDGVTAKLGAEAYTSPDAEMTEMIAAALQHHHIPVHKGKSASVPATLWHGDETLIDPDAIALELEYAAFCYCAHEVGIKAGGLFVISDTKDHDLLDDSRIPRDPIMLAAFRVIKEQWEK